MEWLGIYFTLLLELSLGIAWLVFPEQPLSGIVTLVLICASMIAVLANSICKKEKYNAPAWVQYLICP